MDVTLLPQILGVLKAAQVSKFKGLDIEVEFLNPAHDPAPPSIQEVPADLPPDLKADDTMSYDKILNWSGSPDQDAAELPLAGDEALAP